MSINALHLTPARAQKECAVAGERERSLIWRSLVKSAKPSRPHHRECSVSVSQPSFIDRSGGTMF
jgi:hypothetical protein